MRFLSRLRSARLCLHPAGIWIIYLSAYVNEFDDGATIPSHAARKGWRGRLAGKRRLHLVFLYSIDLYIIAYPSSRSFCSPERPPRFVFSRTRAWLERRGRRKETAQPCSSPNSTNRTSLSFFRNGPRKYCSEEEQKRETLLALSWLRSFLRARVLAAVLGNGQRGISRATQLVRVPVLFSSLGLSLLVCCLRTRKSTC